MSSTVYNQIRDAILKKQHVIATYNGFRRSMCPHTLGWKNGKEQALFYQFAGGSSTGLSPKGSPNNWRCIPLAGLQDVEVEDGEWFTAPNHSRPQTCVGKVDVEVRF